MGIFTKTLAVLLLPFSILILLEALLVFSLKLPFDKLLVGAILMIILQLGSLISTAVYHKQLRFMNVVTAIAFIAPAALALLINYLPENLRSYITIIVAIMMFTEGLYGLH